MQELRKPRLIVTGEFSAGKTKLINGLMGRDVLPSNVTSTSLPPVWIVEGEEAVHRIDMKGKAHRIDDLSDISVEDTLACLITTTAEILTHVDIIDTPGNSDPNIPAESWERMVRFADMMIWCTGATQAWRQSEKSTVRDLPEELRAQGTLLITQADRVPDETSAAKLKRRVTRDAKDFFASIEMASLIDTDEIARLRTHVIETAKANDARPGKDFRLIESLREKPMPPKVPVKLEHDAILPSEVVKAEPKTKSADVDGKSLRDLWDSFTAGGQFDDLDEAMSSLSTFFEAIDAWYDLVPASSGSPEGPDQAAPPPTHGQEARLQDAAVGE